MTSKNYRPYVEGAFIEEGNWVVKGITDGGYFTQKRQLDEIKHIAEEEDLGRLGTRFFANGVELHYKHHFRWSNSGKVGLEVTVVSYENDEKARRVAEKVGAIVDGSRQNHEGIFRVLTRSFSH